MTLDFQNVVVFMSIAAACAYAGIWLKRRAASFTKKDGCGDDCSCGDRSGSATSELD